MKELAITAGETNGIGYDVLAKLISEGRLDGIPALIFADPARLGPVPASLEVRPYPDSFLALEAAAQSALAGEVAGLVTGPIDKQRWLRDGRNWAGQTDFLGHVCGCVPEMLFVAGDWRVLLLTRHIPLRDVPDSIDLERLAQATKTLRSHLNLANPRIALAGLNPHAGDGGAIGREEVDAWAGWAGELGILGPISPDVIWTTAARDYLAGSKQLHDAMLAPYHDQVLPLIKAVTNLRAVNISIGLPFVRTSPDHGTAYDLVGTGMMDSEPFWQAIVACLAMIQQQSSG